LSCICKYIIKTPVANSQTPHTCLCFLPSLILFFPSPFYFLFTRCCVVRFSIVWDIPFSFLNLMYSLLLLHNSQLIFSMSSGSKLHIIMQWIAILDLDLEEWVKPKNMTWSCRIWRWSLATTILHDQGYILPLAS
jgi:hypothetical protein